MNERMQTEVARIATALERIAAAMETQCENDKLHAWASDAFDCIEEGRELMKAEQIANWTSVNTVVARYIGND